MDENSTLSRNFLTLEETNKVIQLDKMTEVHIL